MSKTEKRIIKVTGSDIAIISANNEDYISLTDMAKNFQGDSVIKNWLQNKNTVEFLGVWEGMYNKDFNSVGFHQIKTEAGTNRFVMSVKQWIERTNAIGIIAKTGRYGSGTFAHKDIAFEFGSWLSPEFKLYLIKEFQRLKEEEARRTDLDWDFRRFLAKANYRIHTDAIKDIVIPGLKVSKDQEWLVYADEADLLNRAVFGMTAREWRLANPTKSKSTNIRDCADVVQLTVLSNLESINAILISSGQDKPARFQQLRTIASQQYQSLLRHDQLASKTSENLFNSRKKTLPLENNVSN